MNSAPAMVPEVRPLEREISAALLRLRRRAPFFATLALYAKFIATDKIPTAATDGRDVLYNPAFLGALPVPHLDGVLMHEVLHAALGHVTRRRERDPQQWNVAADIVVNGILVKNGFELPDGALLDHELDRFSVEEVFAILQRDGEGQRVPEGYSDLLEGGLDGDQDGQGSGDSDGPSAGGGGRKRLDEKTRKAMEEHWRRAVAEAAAVGRTTHAGTLPMGVERAFALAEHPKLDWRAVLWRFLTPTPTDFAAFDRRHLHRGLYLETLESESLRIMICVDTSGSIDEELVGQLMAEVDAMLRAYPGVECWLYYADADVYGPYRIEPGVPLPTPEGGGGTDFRPFFAAVDEQRVDNAVAVYLTDGYGSFPDDAPPWPILWAVTTGGAPDDSFPFGNVLRLGDD